MHLKTLSILWLTQDQIKTVDRFLFVLQQQWTLHREFWGLELDLKLPTAEKNRRVMRDRGVWRQAKKQHSRYLCKNTAQFICRCFASVAVCLEREKNNQSRHQNGDAGQSHSVLWTWLVTYTSHLYTSCLASFSSDRLWYPPGVPYLSYKWKCFIPQICTDLAVIYLTLLYTWRWRYNQCIYTFPLKLCINSVHPAAECVFWVRNNISSNLFTQFYKHFLAILYERGN